MLLEGGLVWEEDLMQIDGFSIQFSIERVQEWLLPSCVVHEVGLIPPVWFLASSVTEVMRVNFKLFDLGNL